MDNSDSSIPRRLRVVNPDMSRESTSLRRDEAHRTLSSSTTLDSPQAPRLRVLNLDVSRESTDIRRLALPTIQLNSFRSIDGGHPDGMWLLIDVLCQEDDALGYLHQLSLDVRIPRGLVHLSTLGQKDRPSINIGEIWSIAIHLCREKSTLKSKLSIPSRLRSLARASTLQPRTSNYSMMDEVQKALIGSARQQPYITLSSSTVVKVSFRHSLLPDSILLSQEMAFELSETSIGTPSGNSESGQPYGAGSLLKKQTQRFTEKFVHMCQEPCLNESDFKKCVQIAESVVRLLQEELRLSASESRNKSVSISTADALNLLEDLGRAMDKYLQPVISMELKLLKSLYVTIQEGERAQAARRASINPRRKPSSGRQTLFSMKSDIAEQLPGPPIIKLNAPPKENHRDGIELDRDSYDFGLVLRDLTNQGPAFSQKQNSQQSLFSRIRRWDPIDPDVPAPLFSPKKRPLKALRSHGYGELQQRKCCPRGDDSNGVSSKISGDPRGPHDVQGPRQSRRSEEAECETASDPAKAIWEKMRVTSVGSGFSDEDEERLQEMNLTSAPWM